jgi:hypothetical protein
MDHRSEGRSNVFLTATLQAGGRSSPVRIRNISARGALVDGPALPAIGASVRLTRGSLSAAGQLAWKGAGQAGLTFDGTIDVADWVRRVGHSGQQRVDSVIAALRSGISPDGPEAALEETLQGISASLDQLCERLAQTPGMSVELGEDLLKLDSIAQALRRLATGRPCREPSPPA